MYHYLKIFLMEHISCYNKFSSVLLYNFFVIFNTSLWLNCHLNKKKHPLSSIPNIDFLQMLIRIQEVQYVHTHTYLYIYICKCISSSCSSQGRTCWGQPPAGQCNHFYENLRTTTCAGSTILHPDRRTENFFYSSVPSDDCVHLPSISSSVNFTTIFYIDRYEACFKGVDVQTLFTSCYVHTMQEVRGALAYLIIEQHPFGQGFLLKK